MRVTNGGYCGKRGGGVGVTVGLVIAGEGF